MTLSPIHFPSFFSKRDSTQGVRQNLGKEGQANPRLLSILGFTNNRSKSPEARARHGSGVWREAFDTLDSSESCANHVCISRSREINLADIFAISRNSNPKARPKKPPKCVGTNGRVIGEARPGKVSASRIHS
jgi:hypothetical protein